jgi:UDP-N-acetyl-D-glucosamine dehydrogenase
LGGHCIPIDPYYLAWLARKHGLNTRFIELAGEINTSMPRFVVDKVAQALNTHFGRGLRGARILIVGVAYKEGVGDLREAPALKIIELLRNAGSNVSYHDPHVPALPDQGLASVALEPTKYDCVVIVTAHTSIDYDWLVEEAELVVDFRNATGRNGSANGKVWKL